MKAVGILVLAFTAALAGQSVSATTFTIGQTSVAFTADETNLVSVACPAGYFSTGGGYSVSSSPYLNYFLQNVINVVDVTGNKPVESVVWGSNVIGVPAFIPYEDQPASTSGTGWSVGGHANIALTLTVYATCTSEN